MNTSQAAALPENIIEALTAPKFWGQWFRDLNTWSAWFSFLKTTFALPLTDEDRALYQRCTGRTLSLAAVVREVWLICGRRAGKTRIAACIAAYLAVFGRWASHLAPGERASILLIAADRKQARVAMRYLRSLFVDHRGGLSRLIMGETQETITLRNRVQIEVATGSFRTTRGYTLAAVICDEIAFWRADEGSANPAAEIISALRPALATMPGSLLIALSSPYARRGPLWEAYRKHYGRDGDPVLVWKADTRTMNPTVPESVIAEAYENDPAAAAAEFGAEFRTDVETFIAREVVEAAVVPGRFELAPVVGPRYVAFVDPSGGSADAMTLAIAHRDRAENRAILDAVRERRPPFSPEAVVGEFADVLKAYRVSTVTGDRWGGEFVREPFRRHGIKYELSDKSKSDLYRDVLPVLNSGKAELLDLPRLVAQLTSLERRTTRGSGRDVIDHPPLGHDDIANAVCGALLLAEGGRQPLMITREMVARATLAGPRGAMHRMPVFFGR
ncbi:MAG TPA: hypothetical protein VH684_31435 [Xanthobacteraceae bacterium]